MEISFKASTLTRIKDVYFVVMIDEFQDTFKWGNGFLKTFRRIVESQKRVVYAFSGGDVAVIDVEEKRVSEAAFQGKQRRIIEVAHGLNKRNKFISLDNLGEWKKLQEDIDLYSSFFRYYTDDPNVGGVLLHVTNQVKRYRLFPWKARLINL